MGTKKYLGWILLIWITGCQSPSLWSPLAKFEQANVYPRAPYPAGNWFPSGLNYEDAWFTAQDGTQLHGWFVSANHPREVILYTHGNAGNITHRAGLLKKMVERYQIAMLVFDYRGYGRSQGIPDEEGILQDARAARQWLAARTRVSENEIILMGRSLGGGVAVDLAAYDGARALILESTFTSLPAVAQHFLPVLPTKLVMRNRLNSLKKIGNYHGPLLQSHGDKDRVIPFKLGAQLFAKANQPKQFITIPNGDHNDPQSAEYYRVLGNFLNSLPPKNRFSEH